MEEKKERNKFQFLPSFLYHYTSIDAFTQIIKTKTFRFTKLSLLNDPLEGITEDFENSSKLVYCSSWTANNEDNIPLWKLYTNLQGVRIKMSVNFFQIKNLIREKEYTISVLKKPIYLNCKINDEVKSITIRHIYGPDPIIYTNDNSKIKIIENVVSTPMLYPYEKYFESDMVDLNPVGLYKHKHWMFEEEWRYRITLGKLHPNKTEKASLRFTNMEFINDYYDLPLSKYAFDSMEILLGPKTNDSTKQIIEALCQKFLKGKEINISKSKIQIRK